MSDQLVADAVPAAPTRLGEGPTLPAVGRISAQARRHIELRRRIVKDHPDALALAGPDWRGAPAALVILAVHWTVLWWVSQTNVLVVFLAAFFIGQLAIHSAGALVHETAHRLVFRHPQGKLLFDLLLEAITTSFGRQLTYQHEHVSTHHPYLGVYERDYEHEDVCRFLARRTFRAKHPGRQRLLTALELFLHLLPFGFLFADKIVLPFYARGTGRKTKDTERNIGATKAPAAEQRLFIAVSLAVNVFLFAAFGFLGWLYQIWSLSLFLGKCGVTNLGQSLSEHPGDDVENPTRSTYWWGNWFLFNTGYHHEHHTFPEVAWTRLPALKRLAPDAFVPGTRSYVRLWWEHVRADFSPSRRNALQATDPVRCAGTAHGG
jgi:sphingolipid delta-4 desaturase